MSFHCFHVILKAYSVRQEISFELVSWHNLSLLAGLIECY